MVGVKSFGGEAGPTGRLSQFPRGDGDKQILIAGESAPYAVKPLRRECRIASAEPVCSCAFFLVQFAHETAGAACTRYSLLPLFSRDKFRAKLGRTPRRENAEPYLMPDFVIASQRVA
jgi:hypothetical protein